MRIIDLSKGEKATVLNVDLPEKLCERLKMLNVYSGAQITLLKTAPFKTGYLLSAGSVRLAVGKNVANNIYIERQEL